MERDVKLDPVRGARMGPSAEEGYRVERRPRGAPESRCLEENAESAGRQAIQAAAGWNFARRAGFGKAGLPLRRHEAEHVSHPAVNSRKSIARKSPGSNLSISICCNILPSIDLTEPK